MATCCSMLAQIGRRIDTFMRDAGLAASMAQAHSLMKDYQSVKWVVNRSAIDIVSKAMDLFGGRGYLSSNELTRLYRDVRAGPFMQPHSPIDAREYIGQVVLGLAPASISAEPREHLLELCDHGYCSLFVQKKA